MADSTKHQIDAAQTDLGDRIREIEREIENGFWGEKGMAGAFAVVAKMLAEHEADIKQLKKQIFSLSHDNRGAS